MLQSNILTFLNEPKFFQRKDIDNCTILFSNRFMPHTSVSISIKQAAISALDIFQTIEKSILNVFKFVKEFEEKNKACFFASPTCLFISLFMNRQTPNTHSS